MTIVQPAPYAMQDSVVTFGSPGDDYAAALSKAQLTPTLAQSTFKGLKPLARFPVSGGVDWTFDFTAAQDWETEASLSNYMFDHAGEVVPFTLVPIAGGTSFGGTVVCGPAAVGGQQGADAATGDYSLQAGGITKTPAA